MIPQEGEHVGEEVLLIGHGRLNGIHLDRRPLHAVQRHAVVGLALRHTVFECQHVEHHHLGGLVAEGILQEVVGVPHQLLGATADVRGNAVLLPKNGGHEGFVHLAVSDKKDVMSGFLHRGVILLGQASLGGLGQVFGLENGGQHRHDTRKEQDGGKDAQSADQINFFHVRTPLRKCRR